VAFGAILEASGGMLETAQTGERINHLAPDVARWSSQTSEPVIQLRGVVKRFGDVTVLDGLDLDVHTGLTTVICGQSGSGKSVLLKLMNGLELPDEGQVLVFGKDTREMGAYELIAMRKRISMMFQNYALMDSFTVARNIGFPLLENTEMPRDEILKMAQELLELLDLGDAGDKMPSELSGGMKKRVSLARAVVSNPEVVLFDEPTTGLDPVMIEFVDNMVEDTRERYGITSVIISHDMTSTMRLADRVAMLHEGRILAYGTPEEVMAHDHEIIEVFFEQAGSERGLTTGGTDAGFSSASDAMEAPIVKLTNVHKRFGEHHVLRGVDLAIPKGKITVIIGGSGSGKSVIMKHIIGLMRPDEGAVEVFGEDISRSSDVALIPVRARFGMLFQSAALLDSMTVGQNVAFPLIERGVARKAAREQALETLEQLRIEDIADHATNAISNGQKKRVGLARAIITRPEIMIYDEPTTGQDPVMLRYVDDMIVEAQELFEITSLVVSHDMSSAFRIAHRIAMLHEGEILSFGTPNEVAESQDPWVRRFVFAGTDRGRLAASELGLAF
jgi:phospholipid/cholesterol/gamma-HCH transport system ATP-binding protein